MSKFEIGDIVTLKSGSPIMTVAYIFTVKGQEGKLTCAWFLDYDKKEATFHEEMLEKADKVHLKNGVLTS